LEDQPMLHTMIFNVRNILHGFGTLSSLITSTQISTH
jgi:hypothetical protein